MEPAFGAPGVDPRWTSSKKDAVSTAYSASSRVWFTVSHGTLNEIYYPTIDRPQTRDMELLFTDGETFFHEEKRDIEYDFHYIDPDAPAVRVTGSRSAEAVHGDEGVHRRPAPLGGADECEDHGRRGGAGAAEVLCAAGSASEWRRRGELGAVGAWWRGGGCCWRGRAVTSLAMGCRLRVYAELVRVCGGERRVPGPDDGHEDDAGSLARRWMAISP